MTKKVLAVSLVLCVVFSAAIAIAQPKRPMPQQNQPQPQPREFQYGYCDCRGPRGMWNNQPQPMQFDRNNRNQPQPPQFDRNNRNQPQPPFDGYCWDGRRDFDPRGCDFGARGPRGRFSPDMPNEIRSIAAEIAKLRIDLDEALYARPLDKAKAIDVYEKIMKLEQEINRWRFAQRLERFEAAAKQQELNRNFRPAPPAPNAPQPMPNAPVAPEAPLPENPEAQ